MIRFLMVLTAAALLSGCESRGGKADCEPLDRSPEVAPGCSADTKRSLAEPITDLGFHGDIRWNRNTFDGTITGVEGSTLYIEAEGNPFVFRWHGSWPVPIAVGQQVTLEREPSGHLVTIDGRSLMVITPRSTADASSMAQFLCLEQSLGCRASTLEYALGLEIRTPFFEAELPVGQTQRVGSWMVYNPGVAYTPAHVCDVAAGEIGDDYHRPEFYREEVRGQLLAWTVDRAVLEEDPAWCSGAFEKANRWPGPGDYGYRASTEGQWLPATIGHVDRTDWSYRLSLKVEGVFQAFTWPGKLPSPLYLDDEVEIVVLGEQSTLKTDSHLLWVVEASSLPDQPIPGSPELRYEAECFLSNSSQLAAAVVSWEGETTRLLPGDTAQLGPWTVVHHYGVSGVSAGCTPDGKNWLRALTSASRSLGD